MKNLKKKAFTLVELLVVIAIIAILAVAGVVGYVVFTKKAAQSNDTSFIEQLNGYVLGISAIDEINTVSDVRNALIEDGIDLASLKLTAKGYRPSFDIANKKFVKVKDNSPEDYSGKAEDLFVFVSNEADATTFTNAGYSIYLQNGFSASTLNVKSGVDVGENNGITTINYASTDTKEVVIRTNSPYTTLTINAANDSVNHYGTANVVNVTAVAMSSYHESGSVATLNVKAGRIDIKADAIVGIVAVDKDATSANVAVQNNGIVFATEVITYDASNLNHDVIENPTDAQKAITNTIDTTTASDTIRIGTADALINLASAQSQGIISSALKIELTSDIDLTNRTWVPFGADLTTSEHYAFNGTIDGKNHSIKGLSNGSYRGVQIANNTTGQIGEHYAFIANSGSNVTISNLKFTDVNINSETATVCGTVVAYVSESTLVLNNVSVEGSIIGSDKVAGLIGYAKDASNVTITNCTVKASLTAHEYRIGGFFGFASNATLSISNSSFGGTIVAENINNVAKTYIAAMGSIHAAKAGQPTSLTVSKFAVLENSQIQTGNPNRTITSNSTIIVGLMNGTPATTGITDGVITGQDFSVVVAV